MRGRENSLYKDIKQFTVYLPTGRQAVYSLRLEIVMLNLFQHLSLRPLRLLCALREKGTVE
jgi:hypothetical protein